MVLISLQYLIKVLSVELKLVKKTELQVLVLVLNN